MPDSRPYKCSICALSFGRSEHLHRHITLHTGEKLYQCPCSETFFRSDLLVRHLGRCDKGRDSQERIRTATPKKRTRTKRACDKCAQSKSKCDGRDPCTRCNRQAFSCKYTREGSFGLYSAYSIARNENSLIVPNCDQVSPQESIQLARDQSRDANASSSTPEDSYDTQCSSSEAGMQQIDDQQLPQQEIASITPPEDVDLPTTIQLHLDQNFDFGADLGDSFMNLDNIVADSTDRVQYTNTIGPLECFLPFPTVFEDRFMLYSQPSFYSSFSLEQIDPVEAKCDEIRALLRGSEPLVTDDMISLYITREKLLYFTQLYGKNFRPHFPVVHAPTFNLIQESPFLLLAIVVVGASYSRKVIPSHHITKLAMRVLKLIENQPHEIQMDVPPLPTIQASIIICSVLFRSRSETACKFVSTYFARNLSLIKRTGVFDSVDLIDYNYITEQTFDWKYWVEQESLRRCMCKIVCQDIAGCIFQGISPCISPLDLDIQLPCYESAWEAKTAPECLRQLQNMPQQIHISTAIRYLRTSPATDRALFEASGFGMLIVVAGLHYLLFQATKHDIVLFFGTPETATSEHHSPKSQELVTDMDTRLHQDLSGPTIAALADEAVSLSSFSALKHINDALNAWRATWELQLFREKWCEDYTFFSDPLPFWWLAKLYISLHHYAPLISQDSEFAIPRVETKGDRNKMLVQAKIIRWFSRFRRQKNTIEEQLYDADEVTGVGQPD